MGARATRYVEGRARLFEQRVADGWVCDGHGDLLADDIFCLADGPRVLDCLDFSDQLRYGDVLADVAFLAMDLEHLGAPELAARFLELYDEFSGERHPASLVDYYVAFRGADPRQGVRPPRAAGRHRCTRHAAVELLDLARDHLRDGRVALVLVGGAPGTGKSTVAAWPRRLRRLGGAPLGRRSQGARRPGPPPSTAPAAFGEGLYARDATARTYEELLRRARVALELGESVVLDASWSDARSASRRRTRRRPRPRATWSSCGAMWTPSVADARVDRRRRACTTTRPMPIATSRRRYGAWRRPGRRRAVIDTSGTVPESVASAVRATAAGAAARRTSREVSTEEVWP